MVVAGTSKLLRPSQLLVPFAEVVQKDIMRGGDKWIRGPEGGGQVESSRSLADGMNE